MTSTLKEMKKYKHCYLWIAPFFILFAVFYIYPAVSGFLISLTNFDGLGTVAAADHIGFKNYEKLLRDDKFWKSLMNTVLIWLYIVPLRTFLALILAAVLNSSRLTGKRVYSVIVLLPYITAVAVAAIIFRILLTTEGGLINVLLERCLGIGPVGWLDTTALSKVSVAFMNIWRMTGYFSLVLLAGMQKIPGSVGEAASIDGAGAFTKFFKITLPLMVPEIFFVVLMSTIWIFQNVGDVMVLTQGGPMNSSTTLVYYMYQNAYEYSKMWYSAAITYVLFAFLVILSVFVVKNYYGRTEE